MTHKTAPIAIAASIALPPAAKTYNPARLAKSCGVVTIPRFERAN
ncbi:hypothetical protein [Chroogloeocystis siderophila]|nr:hypothetical protein [Chroogloeocystis siderophila]